MSHNPFENSAYGYPVYPYGANPNAGVSQTSGLRTLHPSPRAYTARDIKSEKRKSELSRARVMQERLALTQRPTQGMIAAVQAYNSTTESKQSRRHTQPSQLHSKPFSSSMPATSRTFSSTSSSPAYVSWMALNSNPSRVNDGLPRAYVHPAYLHWLTAEGYLDHDPNSVAVQDKVNSYPLYNGVQRSDLIKPKPVQPAGVASEFPKSTWINGAWTPCSPVNKRG